MASQKGPRKDKPRRGPPMAPPSTKEPPLITTFDAPPENLAQSITVDDLRRSTTGGSWSVNEKLDGPGRLPRYPLGGSVDGLSVADSSRRIDWAEIFSIPPQNPYLLRRAIELQLLPPQSLALLPVALEEPTHLDLEHPTEQAPPERQQRKVRSTANKEAKKGRKL